ncbi:Protein ARV1 [Trichinella nelsoni]|uniref:Protein ARV n=1 Tax=Trichinella nelsoni TaxID=6336 RepID=A0A0V0RMH6_9BILA|nr:Protein ARV1 [Trichinella nelsoni]
MIQSLICVQCGDSVEELFHKYSATVLKLAHCVSKHCGQIADSYVEYEPAFLLLDLFLQRLPAYRHMLFNMKTMANIHQDRKSSASNADIYEIEFQFYCCLLIAAAVLKLHCEMTIQRQMNCYPIAYYGYLLLFVMVVWDQEENNSVLFLIELFILTTHIQVLRALNKLNFSSAVAVAVISSASTKLMEAFSVYAIR